MASTHVEIYDLHQALKEWEPGILASAIETYGLDGYDRFGRLKSFESGSPEAMAALDALAAEYATLEDEELPSEKYFDGSVYRRYGWREGARPDFSSLDVEVNGRRPNAVSREENASLGIIGALLAYIEGEHGFERHGKFVSKGKLIDELVAEFSGFKGISESNLNKKFPAAKRQLAVERDRRKPTDEG